MTSAHTTPPAADAVTVLVNSSDGFEDCWGPFFHLQQAHWPDCNFPVLLNTETRDWTVPNGRCSRVAHGEPHRLSWSECLIRAIGQVETPLLMYFQEDYFLDRAVDHAKIMAAVDLMLQRPDIGHIALTRHGSFGPYDPFPVEGFAKIRQRARYRISTQAGLWRTQTLLGYLDPHENGWMFEIFGTRRAHRRSDLFLMADFSEGNGGPAVDYVHTGIIKGKWHPAMPNLFAKHGLTTDFSRRGFYVEPHPLLRKWEVIKKLSQDPGHAIRQMLA